MKYKSDLLFLSSVNTIRDNTVDAMRKVSVSCGSFIYKNANHMMLIIGSVLLVGGLIDLSYANQSTSFTGANYNDQLVRNAVGNLFALVEGAFGALIMVVAGVGAIVSSAMGAYRLAMSCLVIAIGAFILRAMVSLFFGENFTSRGIQEDA